MATTVENGETKLRIIHFNDVYHLNEGSIEPVGGAARFHTAVHEARKHMFGYDAQDDILVVFSGDCFNPSIESSVTKGKHMVPFMNTLNIDVACYGNHVSSIIFSFTFIKSRIRILILVWLCWRN
jgi:2',3'-cyclic-nucleotide 2'-phosphodiesterase (5'-nucleotidase family)